MRISSKAKYALGVTAAAAMLAGCSSGASSLAPTTPSGGGAPMAAHGQGLGGLTTRPGLQNVIVRRDTRQSFMSPEAKKAKNLLYISDYGAGDVQVYAWPKPKNPVGTLTGFSGPQGECTDTSGDVYITNTNDSNVLEYKTGGTSPINTLTVSGEYPVGCSVDPKSGDVAVTNIVSTSGGDGDVVVFAGGKGTGKSYTDPSVIEYFFPAYDNKGVIWFSGIGSNGAPSFSSLTLKGKNAKFNDGPITGATIGFPGGTEWDGTHITTNDQDANTVYQLKKFKVIGSTVMSGASDVDQDFIYGSSLIGPDAGNLTVGIYPYPKGGSPTTTLTGFSQPIGSAVTGTSK